MLYGFPLSCILLLALSGLSGWRHGEISIIVRDTRIMLNTASDAQWRCPKSSWRAVMAERQACERAAGTKWEVIVVQQKPGGRGDSTAIHHARWLSRRKSITGVRPSVRPTVRSVWLPGHCFTPPAPALLASSLFIYMRPRRPLCRWKSTLGCHAADPAYYCITAAAGPAVWRTATDRRRDLLD